jgi:hypothetical protein
VSDGLGEGFEFEPSSFDQGSDEMLEANSHLTGAAGQSESVQGSAGEQLRQWLPTVPAAETIDKVEATADEALSQATNITREDAEKLLTQKQTMLTTEARITGHIEEIRSSPVSPETGTINDATPSQIEQSLTGSLPRLEEHTDTETVRSALPDEERVRLAQRRDYVASHNPEDYEKFMKDPDHFSKKTGYRITDSTREEARTALDLREQGKLPADIQRPTGKGEGDFYSPSQNQYYDIKEVNDTPPREFNAAGTEANIERQLIVGRTPILDTSGASQSAINQVVEVLERNGWENSVIWYP